MKNPDKLKLKQIKYFSYGMDYFDNGEEYWYLQTVSDGYCDYSIIESKNKYIPLIIGKIVSFITKKRLEIW